MPKTIRCGSDHCVEIEQTPQGFLFTSSIETNIGTVIYTPAEVAQFLDDVKAGKWDDVHAAARTQASVPA